MDDVDETIGTKKEEDTNIHECFNEKVAAPLQGLSQQRRLPAHLECIFPDWRGNIEAVIVARLLVLTPNFTFFYGAQTSDE
jgi:hypothetical protein